MRNRQRTGGRGGGSATSGRSQAAVTETSRRSVLQAGALGGASLITGGPPRALPGTRAKTLPAAPGTASVGSATMAGAELGHTAGPFEFNQNWLFGGPYTTGSEQPGFDDSGFGAATLPHTVSPLSWGDWDNTTWENVWIYRKHFQLPPVTGRRVLADFDGVMTNATVVLNGTTVATHEGGYLPWSAELTGALTTGDNVLAVIVDSTWLQVPPDGDPRGAVAVDYLQPGGIYRDVTLRVLPQVFLSDVFALPASVLTQDRSVQVQATIDAAAATSAPVLVTATLLGDGGPLATASATVPIGQAGTTTASLTLTGLPEVTLWSPDEPRLYPVVVTLSGPGGEHTLVVNTGFREAVFTETGFLLNGQPLKLFGLNRHQLFPYTGMSAAPRLQRRDAEILKFDLNCNMVRCSHYPQSPDFLDACDELGLMVWEEPPGWSFVGDEAWQAIAVRNVSDMVVRDRSRPSVIVWAARLNETDNFPAFYAQTTAIARQLDGSRQISGAMNRYSTKNWAEDVFAYDDYHSDSTGATLNPPLPGVPYFVSEAVGALDGSPTYRWIDSSSVLGSQALLHAQVHNIAAGNPAYNGLLGWAGFDYASLHGGARIWRNLKTPGVVDTFRVLKPGAAFYQSQVDPRVRPVIAPAFFWDFGPQSPPSGPGAGAMIATNCDELKIYVAGGLLATCSPDTTNFAALPYPPVFTDLTVDGSALPDLRIDGYLAGQLVTSVSMSADTTRDRLVLTADDRVIAADGSDTTRLTFRALDAFGNQRPYVSGDVSLAMTGPALLIGDNPFPFADYGGVGGAFLRSLPGRPGRVTVTATHPALGQSTAHVFVGPAGEARKFL